jgi:hypothetical protein
MLAAVVVTGGAVKVIEAVGGGTMSDDDESAHTARLGRLLSNLAAIVGTLAVVAAIAVMFVGVIYALLENEYSVVDYLEDLKALVLALAAILLALELPAAIHRRINREKKVKDNC